MSMGKTHEGVAVVPGLHVWTNEMRAGVVGQEEKYTPGWFEVYYADGGSVLQNAERVAIYFMGRSAKVAYDASADSTTLTTLHSNH